MDGREGHLEEREALGTEELQVAHQVHRRKVRVLQEEPLSPLLSRVGSCAVQHLGDAVELAIGGANALEDVKVDAKARFEDQPRAVLAEQYAELQPLAVVSGTGENSAARRMQISEGACLLVERSADGDLALPEGLNSDGSECTKRHAHRRDHDPIRDRQQIVDPGGATVYSIPCPPRNDVESLVVDALHHWVGKKGQEGYDQRR